MPKNNNYLLIILSIIPLFSWHCNASSRDWQEIKTALGKIPGTVCSLAIVDDQSAWALTFLDKDLNRSLVAFSCNTWNAVNIPCLDPHLLWVTCDGSVFIVGRDDQYKYMLWQLRHNVWKLLGSLDSAQGYPTNLIARDACSALVAICPCRGSNQLRSSMYVCDNDKFTFIPDVLNSNALCLDDEDTLCADITITKNLSDNNSFFKTVNPLGTVPPHTTEIIVKNESTKWVLAGCDEINLFCWSSKKNTWIKELPTNGFLIKGTGNKKVYRLTGNNKLFVAR